MKSFQTHSSEETIQLGRSFAQSLKAGDVVALTGELGTGKTHFIAGACDGLGVRARISSPTFTLINEYRAESCIVVHIDLYRITSHAELTELGIEEYFSERHICLIEWAERMAEFLPRSFIQIELAHGQKENDRTILIDHARNAAQRSDGVVV
jgi:tRNA threonylcarbamoyladenosine biosynthesis protein TsaE